MANGQVIAPSWDQLLNVGIGYVKESQPAWMFVGAVVGIQVVQAILIFVVFGGGSPRALMTGGIIVGILSLVAAVATIYLMLMLSRHALTGEWGLKDSDHNAVLRLIGVGILVALGLGLIIAVVGGGLTVAFGYFGAILAGLIALGLALWLASRIGFYLPALAVGHPTSLAIAFEQSAPYWVSILCAFIIPAIAALAVNWLLGLVLGGLFGALIAAIVGGACMAIAQAISIAAVSYLYANFVRTGQPG